MGLFKKLLIPTCIGIAEWRVGVFENGFGENNHHKEHNHRSDSTNKPILLCRFVFSKGYKEENDNRKKHENGGGKSRIIESVGVQVVYATLYMHKSF